MNYSVSNQIYFIHSLLFSLLIIFFSTKTSAQQAPNQTSNAYCGIEQAFESASKIYPDLPEKSRIALEQFNTKAQLLQLKTMMTDDIVPVVFHLITPCENNFDFTKVELEDVLTEVNADFTAQNTDEYNSTIDPTFYTDQADIGITFKLAEIDPYGNPTDGITRSNSFYSIQGSSFQIPLKQIIQWNPSRYLNVWIVENVNTSGYAQYPWTAEEYPGLDGIVMSYDYVGEGNINNRPHILTHEIGHWLGLLHTWGDFTTAGSCADPAPTYCDCDDFVDDTPNCLGYSSISCPSTLPNSCTDPTNDRPDNIFNFMDYACEVMFTNDQKTRMLQIIAAGTADRDQAVTSDNDPNVFMLANSDNSDAKLYLDRVVYTESFASPGTVQEVGIIELRDCVGCSFSTNIGNLFTTTGLPTNILSGFQITRLNNTQAQISFDVMLTDFADHDPSADIIFDLNFNANAINGISNTSQVFNNAAIKGLKIDFIDNYLDVMSTTFGTGEYVVNTLTDGDFASAYIPHLNQYVGFYHYQNSFYMYTASTFPMEAAVTASGSYNVKRLATGESLPSQIFQPITPGIFGQSDELVVYDAGSYTDWLNQSGYVGVRVTTFCGEQYYVSVGISVTSSELALTDVSINAHPNGALQAGQSEICLPDRTIAETFSNGNNIYFDVTDWISSSSTVKSGADITYDAGDEIHLDNDFKVEPGAEFTAIIEGCECIPDIPILSDLSHTGDCDYGYLYCNNHSGDNKEYELLNVSTGNTTTYTTTEYYQYVTLTPSTDYQFRVRKQCGTSGIFGGWSAYHNFTTSDCGGCVPDVPVLSDLSHTEYCDYGYLYCNNHTGDNKEYELLNVSTGNTTTYTNIEYYQYVTLTPNTNYQFRVRLQCGTSGAFGGWSSYHSFTTSDCSACVPDVPVLADLSHDEYCNYGYLYCNNHTGDNKEYELLNVSTGNTTTYTNIEYYQYVTLTPNTDYQFRVRLQCGTSGNFGGWSPYHSFSTCAVFDCDGNSYNTVEIGSQTWMAENLKTTCFNDGTPIPWANSNSEWQILSPTGTASTPAGGFAAYDSNHPYGAMYNWFVANPTVNGGLNVCPVGWHVPTDTDYQTLILYLDPNASGTNLNSNVAGGAMKTTGTIEAGTGLWKTPNTGATNSSQFSADPNGTISASFWTQDSTPSSPVVGGTGARGRSLQYSDANLRANNSDASSRKPIRCVKD